MRDLSTARSRTTGKERMGSRRIGSARLSTSALQAWRALPLITIEQLPHTSSRQLDSQNTGVVGRPSAVTGLRWICMRAKITFMLGRRSTANASQTDGADGFACRRTASRTVASLAWVGVAPAFTSLPRRGVAGEAG